MYAGKICIAILLAATAPFAAAQKLVLTNPLNVDRTQEVVEVPLHQVLEQLHLKPDQAASIVASDAVSGQRLPSQLYSAEANGQPDQLLLLVQLREHEVERIVFRTDSQASAQTALVFGREAPERKDDFAWENQQVAYRVYGPALQATGEIASGIDVWSKRVPNFVIDAFYKRDLEGVHTHNPALSYHKDNGQGLDSYYVGPSRGCGGTAVFADSKLYVSKNYTTKRTLSNGPIRFAFEVSYAPWDSPQGSVTETKRITLDAGTHLNKIESTYSFAGSGTLELAAAIAVHEGAKAEFPLANSIASVWDTPQDASAGRISTGLVVAANQHARSVEAAGHALMLFTRHSGESFTYYAGSGWSKADMPTNDAWKAYLGLQLQMQEHPILMRWSE